MEPKRNQSEARGVAKRAYPFPGCCLCGQTVGLELAHLNHNSANNRRGNLAWLCRQHHWMFDIGLFSLKALKIQRAYWQTTRGKRTNAYMKDAGRKAVETRAKNARRAIALKAVKTRRARAILARVAIRPGRGKAKSQKTLSR